MSIKQRVIYRFWDGGSTQKWRILTSPREILEQLYALNRSRYCPIELPLDKNLVKKMNMKLLKEIVRLAGKQLITDNANSIIFFKDHPKKELKQRAFRRYIANHKELQNHLFSILL